MLKQGIGIVSQGAILIGLMIAPGYAQTVEAPTIITSPPPIASVAAGKKVEKGEQSTFYKAAYELVDLQQGGPELSPMLIESMREQFKKILSGGDAYGSLEVIYPGLIDAILDDLIPIVVRQTNRTLPNLFERQARLLGENFSLIELKNLERLFSSPTFRRIRLAGESNLDVGSLDDLINQDREINTSDLQNVRNDTVNNLLPTLSDTDNKYLIKAYANPVFRKYSQFKPRLDKIEAEWSNESTPEDELEIDQVINKTYDDHIAKLEAQQNEGE